MDILTHAATGLLLSASFDEPVAKVACVIGSILPDTALLPVYQYAYRHREGEKKSILQQISSPLPENILIPYRIMHSFVPVTFLAAAGYFFIIPPLLGFSLGHFSHILWDIPTHTRHFACRPFYPLSGKKWEGWGDWWVGHTGKALVAGTWVMLFGAIFLMK